MDLIAWRVLVCLCFNVGEFVKRFFVIGAPRSGTTLLRLMLNRHPEVCVPPEAGFLVWLYNKYSVEARAGQKEKFLSDLKDTKKIESWNLDFSLLSGYLQRDSGGSYAELMDSIYRFYAERVLGKEVEHFGDKNNYYLEHVDLLHKMFPSAKYVHIVRDGRSVAASYKRLMQKEMRSKYAPVLPTDIADIASEWRANILRVHESFDNLPGGLSIAVRYEDLVLHTEETLKRVSNFLGFDFHSDMLTYYLTSEREGLEPTEYMEWKEKNLKPIDSSSVTAYQALSDGDRKHFESVNFDLLKEYQYL